MKILNFASIVNKSCKCDLYHLGEPYNLNGKHTLVEKMVFMIGLFGLWSLESHVVYAIFSCICLVMEACFLLMK